MADYKIKELIKWLDNGRFDKKELYHFISQLNLIDEDLIKWTDFNHTEADSYGRKVVYAGPHFELMVMSWVPDDFSMIHNHGDASWGIVQVFGNLTHRVFRLDDMCLTIVNEELLSNGRVMPVSDQLIHQMGNATDECILSLHFYFNESPTSIVTDNTYLFDVANECILTVRGGAFYGLPDEEILDIKEGLTSPDSLKEQEEKLLKHRLSVTV